MNPAGCCACRGAGASLAGATGAGAGGESRRCLCLGLESVSVVVSAEEGGRGVNQVGNSGEVGAQLGLSVSTPVRFADGASLCVARRGDLVGEDEVVFVGKGGDADRCLVVPGFI